MKLTAIKSDITLPNRIRVEDANGRELGIVFCDQRVKFNLTDDLTAYEIDKIRMVATNFNIWFYNLQVTKEEARETLQDEGRALVILWSVEDVIARAIERKKKVSLQQAKEILSLIDRRHDANIGVNWDVIDVWTDEYLNEQKPKRKATKRKK